MAALAITGFFAEGRVVNLRRALQPNVALLPTRAPLDNASASPLAGFAVTQVNAAWLARRDRLQLPAMAFCRSFHSGLQKVCQRSTSSCFPALLIDIIHEPSYEVGDQASVRGSAPLRLRHPCRDCRTAPPAPPAAAARWHGHKVRAVRAVECLRFEPTARRWIDDPDIILAVIGVGQGGVEITSSRLARQRIEMQRHRDQHPLPEMSD